MENKIILSVAIGSQYELEAARLNRALKGIVQIFDKSNSKYSQISKDSLIDGLYHKANFANYFDADQNTPVLFMDADMFSLNENPFNDFVVAPETDIAFVPYSGNWHHPDQIRQNAYDHFGYKINSGFLYFKNIEIAKLICSAWSEEYLERVKLYDVAPNITKFEYDEYALMIALSKLNLNIELLNFKWNAWELNSLEEIKSSSAVFFQSHSFLNII